MIWLKRYWTLVLLVSMQLVFLASAWIDLYLSAWFFNSPRGFLLGESTAVDSLRDLLEALPFFAVLPLGWLMLASSIWGGKPEAPLRRRLSYLLLLILLAPGLLANLLSDRSGRAHPTDITAFGGDHSLTAAFRPAGECNADCSFVSVAAATAFSLIGLAWVFGKVRWLLIGLVAGAAVGLLLVAAGDHFISDVVFAFWLVYGVALVLARLVLGRFGVTDRVS